MVGLRLVSCVGLAVDGLYIILHDSFRVLGGRIWHIGPEVHALLSCLSGVLHSKLTCGIIWAFVKTDCFRPGQG